MRTANVTVLTDAGGAHLQSYLNALAAAPEVASVVIGDPSGSSEKSAREILGWKLETYARTHARALASQRADLALITLEGAKSPDVIRAALNADCHVLAEKPSCVRAEDFEPLVRLGEMKHRNLTLALANRMRSTVRTARQLIQTGKLGRIYGCELHLIADQTRLKSPAYQQSWFADRARSGGGHLMWLGIHWIDLIMFITGSQIVETAGFTGNVGGQPLNIEDSAAMALRFDNGSFGTVTSGYYLEKGYHSGLKLWGAHGWLQLAPHGGEALQWFSSKDVPSRVSHYDGPPDEVGYGPFVRACVLAALGQQPPPASGAESLHVLKTIFACYRSAETGRSQKVV
jgi:predicted dehydrogenase